MDELSIKLEMIDPETNESRASGTVEAVKINGNRYCGAASWFNESGQLLTLAKVEFIYKQWAHGGYSLEGGWTDQYGFYVLDIDVGIARA